MNKIFTLVIFFFLAAFRLSACPGAPNFSFTSPWCENVQQSFNNTSNGTGVTSYTWVWGDGSANTVVATAANQTHTYTASGVYQIKLIRVFSNGCTDSIMQNITIVSNTIAPPTFSFTPNNGCSNNAVQFTNTTVPSAGLNFNWNFGDASSGNQNTSNNNNPSHQFTATGNGGSTTYTVSLISTNSAGCKDTTTGTVMVGNRPDALLADSNIFSPFNNCGFASVSTPGYYIAVTNGSSTSATNANYTIDWGDGSPVFNSATFTQTNHVYSALGIYDLLLTVTGTNGCVDTAHYSVVNLSNPSVGISGPGSTNGCAPQTFVFNVQLDSANLAYTSYNFNFGDGTPIVSWTPPVTTNTISHTYNTSSCGQAGNQFTVQVTAKNACDSTTSTVNNIKISTKPVATFTYTPTPGCVNVPVTFLNQTTPGCFISGSSASTATSFTWSWGDGTPNTTTASFGNQVHTYTATGTYNVTLTATNPCGNTSMTVPVNIIGPPLAAFTNTPPGCLPVAIDFTNLSTGSNMSYNWTVASMLGVSFTSGTNNTSTNPEITFNQAGTFTVTLTTSNSCGSSIADTVLLIKTIPTVVLSPIAGGCEPYTTTPVAAFTAGGGTITAYNWNFVGGNPATANTAVAPAVTWTNDGSYSVNVSATNECGTAYDTVTFIVKPLPVSNAGTDVAVCAGQSDTIGTTATAGYAYSWQSIPAGFSSTSSSPAVTPASTTTYVVTSNLNGCTTTDTVIVTVNPLPVVSAGVNQTVCIDATPFNLNGTPAGGTWSGTGITNAASGTFDPSTAGAGTFTLTYSYTDGATGCSNTSTVQVAVVALPVVNAGPDFTECNQPGTITLSGYSPAGGTWSGTGVTAGGVFSPSTAGVGTFPLVYTFTNANGCTNTDTLNATVINSTAANAGTDDTVCVNAPAFNFPGFSPAGGTWSGTGITNASAGTFNPAISGAGTFTLVYSFGTGTCATSDTLIMLVNPLPVVNAGVNETMCIDAASYNLSGFNPAGGSWSGTGITNAASGTFDPAVAGAGTHTLTYSFTDPVTGCINSSAKTVTVNPLPVVNAGTGTAYCNQPSTITLTGFSPAGGTWTGNGITNASGVFDPSLAPIGNDTLTYTFTNANGCVNSDTIINVIQAPSIADAGPDDTLCVSDPSFNLSGNSPAGGTWSGTGITNATAGTFNPTVSGSGTFALTYSYGTGTCLTTDTKSILVNALPTVNAGAADIVCLNSPAYNMSGFSPAGGTWSGTGITNASNGTFDPATAGTGTHTLTYTYTDPLTGCINSATKTVTVNALPVVDAGAGTTVCDQPITYTLTGYSPAGGTWSGTGVSGGGVFDPSVAGVGTFTLTYTFTSGLGCTVSDTVIMNVVTPAVANAGPNDTICLNGGQLTLSGFTPAAGTWTGTGIINSAGVFDPLVSGVGDFTITYSYGAGTCFTQSTKIVHVDTMPFIVPGPNEIVCISTPAYNLSGYTPVGGTWTGTGITNGANGTFDPALAGAGTYTLTYTYTDPQTNCTDFKTKTITVEPLPVLSFTFPSPTCINSPVAFTNATTGASVYAWNFGDGNSSALQSPANTYTATGTYNVQLIASTANGCSDSLTDTIELIEPPIANFTIMPDTGCAPLTVNFTDLSSGSYITYNWSFGDGTTSSVTNPPAVTYTNGSVDTTYIVTLTVSNMCGSVSHLDTVNVFYPWLDAIFGTNYSVNCSPMTVQFSSQTLGLSSLYTWDFGDGTTGTGAFPPPHTYYYNGTTDTTYYITMIAYNHCRSDTTIQPLTVYPNIVSAFFNSSNTNGCVPHTVTFTDFSNGGTNVSWDFGDGNISNVLSPTHTFTTPGTYTVSEFVNNGCGFDTATVVVNVYPPAGISFNFTPNPVCVNQPATFNNTSTGAGGYSWNFGDGTTSTINSPTHLYSSGGTFTVTLTATSMTYGCLDSIQQVITVFQPPVAAFTPSPLFGCEPLPVTFNNTSSNATFYTWDFGDGNTSAAISPSNTFLTTGTYTVELLAENLDGCKDSVTATINVYPIPSASFTVNPPYGCGTPADATFTNTSVGPVNYSWDFGNGQTALTTNGNATYTALGTYTIQLIASNTFGCVDTAYSTYTVYPKPVASFTPLTAAGCDPLSVQFTNLSTDATLYVWSFTDGDSSSAADPLHVFSPAGTYGVQLIAISNGSCADTLNVPGLATVYPEPVADFTYSQVIVDEIPDGTIEFTNISTNSTSYEWFFGDGDSSSLVNPVHQFIAVGEYTTMLVATNQFGCVDTVTNLVMPEYFQSLFVPNAFMPGSPYEDLQFFMPVGKSIIEYRIQVYNTWGALMWESTLLNPDGSPAEGWDGTFQGQPCHQDIYVWKIHARFANGELWRGKTYSDGTVQPTGSVHLIR